MLLLNRAHIGEVQASIWPQEMIDECEKIIFIYYKKKSIHAIDFLCLKITKDSYKNKES